MNPDCHTTTSLTELLAQYEAEHETLRKLVLPQDDNRHRQAWHGGYRWFASANVICLEKVRHVKQQRAQQATVPRELPGLPF
jgi:hypothetical protein